MDSVRADIQNKIQHLDSDNVPTGILYDRTLPISNLPGYGSLHSIIPEEPSETKSSAGHYFSAMEDLYSNPRTTPVQFKIVAVVQPPPQPENFVVYPVPAQDLVTISSINNAEVFKEYKAVLFDIFGREQITAQTTTANSISMDVSQFQEGIYILKIISKDGKEIIKYINIEK